MRVVALSFAALCGLAACGAPYPEDFTISMEDKAALGFAKTAEFSDAEIQQALTHLCSGGRISNYTITETTVSGTIFFGANCAAGFLSIPSDQASTTIYVTRQSNGTLAYSNRS